MSIIDLFLRLDRAGPGDAESLRWALRVAGTRPGARVLDAGCGVGADTGTLLAALPGAEITALDAAEPFVDVVAGKYPAVTAVAGDLRTPRPGPWDLIWSAGAVYNVGIGPALSAWRPLLAPGGRVAFSHLCWTGAARPEEAVELFASEGFEPGEAAALEAEVTAAGWRVLAARWVGRAGWAAYYEPLAEALRDEPDTELAAAMRAEIDCWRRDGDAYDYRLVVAEPA